MGTDGSCPNPPRRERTLSRGRFLRGFGVAVAAAVLGGRTVHAGKPLDVRKNARTLSDAERARYVRAVLALKQKPSPYLEGISSYDTFTYWHREAFDPQIEAAYMGPAFLPWHRMFLLMFEWELQSVEPGVTIPYWDWTVDRSRDSYLWAPDFMGGNGDPAQNFAVTTGPFAKGRWELVVFDDEDTQQIPYLIRNLAGFPGIPDLPTAAEVEQSLSIEAYDTAPWSQLSDVTRSFRNNLEGWRGCVGHSGHMGVSCAGPSAMHNAVHLWVAGEFQFSHEEDTPDEADDDVTGTMAADTSPNDPVFWLHHANIDRLWTEWQRRHGIHSYAPTAGGPHGHNLEDRMWPYDTIGMTVRPRDMLDHRALGYAYDSELR